jgi:hypothetical protein
MEFYTMAAAAAVVIALAMTGLAIYFQIRLDKVVKRMLKLEQGAQNMEVELFFPIAQAEINGKKETRLTMNGAVKAIFDAMNKKQGKPKIIIPGMQDIKLK